jgi:hypothetical protein
MEKHSKGNRMKKQLFYTHLLSGLFATAILGQQPLQAQWSAPVIYVKGVNDNWQTRSSNGSGYDYTLTLSRQSSGLRKKDWIPDWQFQQTYGTSGWAVEFKEWNWIGNTYQFRESQTGNWNCCENNLPWPSANERIQVGQQGSAYWRSKDTWLEIATGGSERNSKFVLLTAYGSAYTSWTSSGIDGPVPTGGYSLAWDQLTLMGSGLNPDHRRFRKVPANTTLAATPSSTVSSYSFSVGIEPHKLQVLSVSRHPGANNRDWQTAFDIGSETLGKDDDGNGNTGAFEDEGCYVEFLIKPASNQTFPAAYQDDIYNNLRDEFRMFELAGATFANLKTVSSIETTQNNVTTSHAAFANAIPGVSVVLTAGAPAITTVHEYGHLCGLDHRGEGNNTQGYDPGKAIMGQPNAPGANEVNGYELGYFEGPSIPTLGL